MQVTNTKVIPVLAQGQIKQVQNRILTLQPLKFLVE